MRSSTGPPIRCGPGCMCRGRWTMTGAGNMSPYQCAMKASAWTNNRRTPASTRGKAPEKTGDRDSISPNTWSVSTRGKYGSARNTRRPARGPNSSLSSRSSRRRRMFKVLSADDDIEDRELLKLEIRRALDQESSPPSIRFFEAVSVREARKLLANQVFDLMTLDIEFDRLSEGIDALPELFESYPSLN